MKMAVSEQDLELLETYLDGELSGSEVDALIDRLRTDPALATAMETAKAERQVRMAIWTSCEPIPSSLSREPASCRTPWRKPVAERPRNTT